MILWDCSPESFPCSDFTGCPQVTLLVGSAVGILIALVVLGLSQGVAPPTGLPRAHSECHCQPAQQCMYINPRMFDQVMDADFTLVTEKEFVGSESTTDYEY